MLARLLLYEPSDYSLGQVLQSEGMQIEVGWCEYQRPAAKYNM